MVKGSHITISVLTETISAHSSITDIKNQIYRYIPYIGLKKNDIGKKKGISVSLTTPDEYIGYCFTGREVIWS